MEQSAACDEITKRRNQNVRSNNTSGFKGVSWNKRDRKWEARIRNKSLGYFNDPTEAIAAYNAASREAFGEYHFSGTEIQAAA